ncbi:MAG TPA: TIGR03560 family F420-dependent LLM class oxidoreductase [Mycobacteriales bacterium]|jgi:F420-dependent oxidoreductase-like protein|nr:TIGR03560 family F420-dependent LLM class oxidoreductase [Mycobacteriales bacterium]
MFRVFTEPQQGASYDQLLTVARTAEAAGFGAFFRSDHYLKMGEVSGLPGVTDAWTTLAGLARDTSTIRLGTLVTPVTFRHPGSFAVIAAQVDQMSGGRVDIGIGAGWYGAEHDAFGIPFPELADRYNLLEDQLAILAGAWSAPSGSTFDFEGKAASAHIAADTIRPAQSPRPPIVMGGFGGPKSARLAATYAAEYNVPFASLETTKATHDKVRAACEATGRDPGSVVYSAALVLCCGETEPEIARRAAAIGREVGELRENGLAGTPAELLDKLGRFAAEGVERFYLQLLDVNDLDHLRLVAEQVMPHAPGS